MIRAAVPGDKSISHRAALLAPLAGGESRVRGISGGADVRASIEAMRKLGAEIEVTGEREAGLDLRLCRGAFPRAPAAPIDCGNSGTTARLLCGLIAGGGAGGTLDGDASLRTRPMRRVVYPLQAMGARITYLGKPDRLPLEIGPRASGSLRTLRHRARVASAQVKSALLLSGLTGGVRIEVVEPARSRDHTERMLSAMGAPVVFDPERSGEGAVILDPAGWGGRLSGLDITVPGDPSSAAFLIGAALLTGGTLEIAGVGANPGRIGFLGVLERMGVSVGRRPEAVEAGEPVETWRVEPGGALRAFEVGGEEIPSLIDEVPLLAVLAVRARGRSVVRDAAELRVKESDRIAVLARNLERLGVAVSERDDGLEIVGTDAPLEGRVRTHGDHRLAMAFGVLGAASDARLAIDDRACAAVSYPGFWDALEPFVAGEIAVRGGARGTRESGDEGGRGARAGGPGGRVIAIDGPAASGKSTTARAVARRLGFVHVNSGLLYRAITWWALQEELDESTKAFSRRVADLAIELVPSEEGLTVAVEGRRPGDALYGANVAARVSAVSRVSAVRTAVLTRLREAAGRYDLVCDGRDIGTTVFPGAPLKVFLVATAAERARRRVLERGGAATDRAVEEERERLRARDRADETRELSPLRRAPDAVEIDTTALDPEEVVRAIVRLATERGIA